MTLSQQLAARIVALTYEDLPATAIDNAKTAILDTLGCALAGAREHAVDTLMATPGMATSGECSLMGRSERLDLLSAALINGCAAHALDFDDVNTAMGGHPSAPLLAGLLPLAEELDSSGRTLLLSFIAGFETETRLARAVNFHHYDLGWHPTATLGVFGTAAACAKLLNLSANRTATALSICVSLASGVKANFGTMTKPFHVGHAARHGVMAALMARQGFSASLDAFEHRQGFFNVFNGEGNYHADRALENWAAPLDIVTPGIGIKLYPCCDSTHASIDAVRLLQGEQAFDVTDVERVVVTIHPLRLTHVDRPVLRSATDARFSVQYCIARTLLDGRIDFDSFTEHAYENEAAKSLMAKVETRPHAHSAPTPEGNYLTELCIVLRDGSQRFKRLDRPLGRHAEEPAPPAMIRAKFDRCTAYVLSAEAGSRLHDTVMGLETLTRVSELTAQARSPE
ncbi:MmgE/PrpD family protein [Salinicola acroporae]|uniref:MmgE/PrpD family protein n=1 Tax=Salinicola acroporae TaxID=1541440 RepID=A0ABT6I3S6_9GAMM|nr:MmgE/PrpD family protein [Salinicola acroporae]MDH4571860.1 MmgE/PrpD family protein [Salinicola acroporae]